MPTAGSTRWAAPTAPNRWFDAEALQRSRSYHAPLARAAVVRFCLQALGVLLVAVVGHWAIGPPGRHEFGVALVVGGVTALVVWLPQFVVDLWAQYRHEPRFGGVPVAVDRFATVAAASTVGVFTLGALVSMALHAVAVASPWWPVVMVVIAGGVMIVVGPLATRAAHPSAPLEPDVEAELRLVAHAGGVPAVRFARLASTSERGVNALALGGVGAPAVLCSDELLRADPDVRNFVVAHEIAHLRRGDHRGALAASLIGWCVEVLGLWFVDRWLLDRFDSGVADPRNFPIAVAVVGTLSLPVGLVEAWRSRAQERRADLGAVGTVGTPSLDALRSIHEHDRSDLDPGFLARLFGLHPPPAERLMRLTRLTHHPGR